MKDLNQLSLPSPPYPANAFVICYILYHRKGARFCGEVSYRHLRVEPGASLEARMHHVCPTTSAAPPAATVTMPTAEEVASPPAGGDGGNVESDAPPAPASALTAGPAAAPATEESEGREEVTGESEADEAPGPMTLGAAVNTPLAATTVAADVAATVPPSTLPAATTADAAAAVPPSTLPAATKIAEYAAAAAPPSTPPAGKSAVDAAAAAPPSPAAVAATTSIVNQQKLHQHQQMPWMPNVPTTTVAEVPAAWGVMMAAMAAGGMLPSEEQEQEEGAAGAVGKKQRPWTWSAVRAARARARAAEAEAGGGASLVGGPMAARARRTAAAATAAAITSASHSKSTAAAGVDSNDAPAGGELHQEDHEKEGEATAAPGGSARSRRVWASKEATATIPTEIAASPRPVGLLRKHGAASNPWPTCASTKEEEKKSDLAVEVDPAVLAALPPVPAALDAAVAAMEAAKDRSGSAMVAPVVRKVEASADSGGGVSKGVATSAVGLSEISAAADSPGAASSSTSNDNVKNNSDSRRFCWNTPPPTCRLPASEKAALVEEGKRALLAVRKEKHERQRMMALASAVTTLQATERDSCEKSGTPLPSSPMTTPARSRDRFQARSPNRPRPRSPDRPKPRSPDRSQPRSPDRFQPHSPGRFQPRSPDRSQSRTPMWVSPWSPARSPGRSPGRPRRNLTRAPSSQQAASDNKEGGKKTTKTVEKPPPLTLHEKAAAAAVPWAAVGAEVGGGNKARPVSKLSEAKAFLLGLVSAAPHQAPLQQQQPQDSSGAIGDGIGDDSTDPSGGHADNDGNDISGRGRSRGRSKTREGEVFEASAQEASVGGGGMLHLIRGRWARDKGRSLRRARSLDKPTKASRKRKGGIVADEPCDPASSTMVTLSGTRCARPGDIVKNEEENERLVVSVPSGGEGGSEGGGVGEGGGSACVASSPVRAPVRAPLVRQGRFRRSTSMPDSVSALARTGADADAGGGFETGDGGKAGGDGVKASLAEARPKSEEHGGIADSKACSTVLGGVAEAGEGGVVATTRRARGWRRMVTGPVD